MSLTCRSTAVALVGPYMLIAAGCSVAATAAFDHDRMLADVRLDGVESINAPQPSAIRAGVARLLRRAQQDPDFSIT